MRVLLRWLIMTICIMLCPYIVPGVGVTGFYSALWVALFLGVVNIILKPVLIFITLPVNIVTLGLFTFVINAVLVLLAASVIKGFYVNGFWPAVLVGIILSIVNFLLNALFSGERQR